MVKFVSAYDEARVDYNTQTDRLVSIRGAERDIERAFEREGDDIVEVIYTDPVQIYIYDQFGKLLRAESEGQPIVPRYKQPIVSSRPWYPQVIPTANSVNSASVPEKDEYRQRSPPRMAPRSPPRMAPRMTPRSPPRMIPRMTPRSHRMGRPVQVSSLLNQGSILNRPRRPRLTVGSSKMFEEEDRLDAEERARQAERTRLQLRIPTRRY